MILSIAKKARRDILSLWDSKDLGGACGVASWHLMCLLRSKGIKCDFAFIDGHCWLELDNNYILDITATQFNKTFYGKPTLNKSFKNIVYLKKQNYLEYEQINFIKSNYNRRKLFKKSESALKYIREWTDILRPKDYRNLKLEQKKFINDVIK